MKTKILIGTICSIVFFLFNETHVFAQSQPATSFQFEPPVFIVNISQGSFEKRDIYIQNKNKRDALQASLYVNNFDAENGGNTVSFFISQNKDNDIASWVKPELSAITLKPLEGQYETLDIHIPDYVKSGTYTGVLFIDPISTPPASGIGSAVHGRAGVNMLINVYKNDSEYSSLYKGALLANLHIPLVSFASDVTISGEIKNAGHFLVSDDLSVTIDTILQHHVQTLVYKSIHTLPNQYRYLDGVHQSMIVHHLSLGIYKAKFLLLDNLKGTTISHTIYFTVIPIYSIIIAAFVFPVILVLILYALHRRKHPKYSKGF